MKAQVIKLMHAGQCVNTREKAYRITMVKDHLPGFPASCVLKVLIFKFLKVLEISV
jgi:hypothetical protein